MRSINHHFAVSLRKSLLAFWGMIWICTTLASVALIHWTKSRELNDTLEIAGTTVDGAISASDWPMALRHLQTVSRTMGLYDLKISLPADSSVNSTIMDPVGVRPFGIVPICSGANLSADARISGCRNLLGSTELGIFLFFTISLSILGSSGLLVVQRNLQKFIEHISRSLESLAKAERIELPSKVQSEIIEVEQIRNRLSDLLLVRSERDRLEAHRILATQVAHDIRAPLAALTVLDGEIGILPDNTRFLLKSAMDRIQGIAKSLLDAHRNGLHSNENHPETPSATEITPIVEAIVTECRLRFAGRAGLNIETELTNQDHVQARIVSSEFARVLSNLIGNACEAISDEGTVRLMTVVEDDEWIRVGISDNGPGIPPEILGRLGQRGATFGKAGGTGLGLYHARSTVEAWGGRLKIQSSKDKGTVVWIDLPSIRGE